MAMSNSATRHFVAFLIAGIALVAFIAGYFSGQFGWWWIGFAVLIVYGGVHSALK
ncbi:MAG: hypothetical protein PHD72_02525 [Patescibacteria group bacterium]|nr:hypothetical protein [Patescibacteria group bacterium]